MDWAFRHALRTLNGVDRVILLYDIYCQYGKKLRARFKSNKFSELNRLSLVGGVGVFHVHGHQQSCWAEYSPGFIPGAGQVDGEILETLWKQLNTISPSTRAMSTAHRKEVLDDHMNDSNWMKLTRMGKSSHHSSYCRPELTPG